MVFTTFLILLGILVKEVVLVWYFDFDFLIVWEPAVVRMGMHTVCRPLTVRQPPKAVNLLLPTSNWRSASLLEYTVEQQQQ